MSKKTKNETEDEIIEEKEVFFFLLNHILYSPNAGNAFAS